VDVNWGDGSADSKFNVSGAGTIPAQSHTYSTAKNDTVSVTISDAKSNKSNAATFEVTVSSNLLPPPKLTSPSNGGTSQSTGPTFTWSNAAGATLYRVMVATKVADLPTDPSAKTGGPSVLIDVSIAAASGATTSYSIPQATLLPGTTYYWEIKSYSSLTGSWSSVYKFKTTSTTPSVTQWGKQIPGSPYVTTNVHGKKVSIPVFSNGTSLNGIDPYTGVATHYLDPISGQYTGLEWQCTEFVNRYYADVYGIKIQSKVSSTNGGMNAKEFYPTLSKDSRFEAFPDKSSKSLPKAGDILCFNESGGNGHVAIVESVDTTNKIVWVVQQNVKEGGSSSNGTDMKFKFSYSGSSTSGYNISAASLGSSYSCYGWLRYKGTSSTPASALSTSLSSSSVNLFADNHITASDVDSDLLN
jgi:surface antigen